MPAKSDKASSADGPGIGARVAAMPTRATGNAIELTTDGSVLGKGQGPWFIDPGWIYDSRSGNAWTWTQQAYPNTPRYGQTTTNTNDQYAHPGVGYQGFQTVKGIERSYFQIDTRGFAGAVINKATMSVWEYESSDFSCTTTYPVDLYPHRADRRPDHLEQLARHSGQPARPRRCRRLRRHRLLRQRRVQVRRHVDLPGAGGNAREPDLRPVRPRRVQPDGLQAARLQAGGRR
ncbi:hypothetical protein ACF9IK_01455 [Kitasatospora hibisci]|uniref:hypothetical protein n=1 Tax=Kitasatospora hibisci TaxID=3369522 RepID=UPI0037551FEB